MTCVGQCNVGGGDASHFWEEATLPAFATVPGLGLRAAEPQPTCDRQTARGTLSLSHPFWDCQLPDCNLACHG